VIEEESVGYGDVEREKEEDRRTQLCVMAIRAGLQYKGQWREENDCGAKNESTFT
jgi:hypothetical protein